MVVHTANLLGAGPDVIKKVVQQSSRDYMMQQLDVSGLEGLTQILLETVVVFCFFGNNSTNKVELNVIT